MSRSSKPDDTSLILRGWYASLYTSRECSCGHPELWHTGLLAGGCCWAGGAALGGCRCTEFEEAA